MKARPRFAGATLRAPFTLSSIVFSTLAALGALLATAPGALAAETICNSTAPSYTTIDGNLVVPDNTTCDLSVGATVNGNVTVGQNAVLYLGGISPLCLTPPCRNGVATVTGNVTVGQNAILEMGGSVTGNMMVGPNAGLVTWQSATIGGNLQANNCAFVALNPFAGPFGAVVGGNVQIGNCSGGTPSPLFGGGCPNGDLCGGSFPAGTAFGSFGPRTMIAGDFQCHNNTGPCILVSAHIDGNVQIMNNVSATSQPSQINGNFIGKNLQCHNNSPNPTGRGNTVAGSREFQCEGF